MSSSGHSNTGPGDGPASIHDVAAAAGVSIATVSRVVNHSPLVAAATAARVREAIERLGYAPNPLAQGLGSGESRIIGLALPRFHGEFMSWLLHGADEEATRLGYHLMITTIAAGPDGRRRPGLIGSRLIDALIAVITDPDDPLARDIRAGGVPAVVIDADLTPHGLDSVILDNEKGTREAVEHLLRWVEPAGLAFVGGPRSNFDTMERARAFTSALADRGHAVGPDQVSHGDYSFDWGREWTLRTHQRGTLPKAILAGNDKIACGIMRAAENLKMYLPEQLRIVGYNDSQISQVVRPRLSTVALPMAEIGAEAVRTLLRRIEDRSAPPVRTKLPTKLIIRESSTTRNF